MSTGLLLKPAQLPSWEAAPGENAGDMVIGLPPSSSLLPPPPPPRLIIEAARASQYHKLEFPTYDGTEDPLDWLNRCEQFFRGQRTMEEEKVWLASYRMTGVAQQWYYQLERGEGVPT